MNDTDTLFPHDSDDTLDTVLRSELRWEAPPELTNRLLAVVENTSVTAVPRDDYLAPPLPPAPRSWYAQLVMVLTTIAVALSFTAAWQFYGIIGTELGLTAIWQQLQAFPTMGLTWLYEQMPVTRSLVDLFTTIQGYLHWLLIAAVLWLVLDNWSTRSTLQSQRA